MADALSPPPFTSYLIENDRTASAVWRQWFMDLTTFINRRNDGWTGTIALAKLTSGGTNGSITVVDGIITDYTAPT